MTLAQSPYSFIRKAGAAALLVAIADLLFFDRPLGWTIGGFALAWAALLGASVPALRRSSPALLALGLAALFGLVLVDDPSLLALALFGAAVSSAALLPRHRFRNAADWALRLATQGLFGLFAPLRDALRVLRLRRRSHVVAAVATLALPVIGGAVFVALFASANPLIGNALARIELPSLGRLIAHIVLWGAVLAVAWPTFRPRAARLRLELDGSGLPGGRLPVATLALSLATFNLIFAVQNALDIAFLWSGAALPEDVTLAGYAHRGAYTLIATALLAGAFVLVALRPGGEAARHPLVRRLVTLWVAQNLLLVASSALRTIDYVEAYQLTVLRIAALAWMALVGTGLALICWRLLREKSAAWLVNANALAAAAVLALASVIDLGAAAAAWNVRHAQDGSRVDLCYLRQLDSSALLPLVELERRAANAPILRDRAAAIRAGILSDLRQRQSDWRAWTGRGARRLARADALLGSSPAQPLPALHGRGCDGAPLRPAPPQPAPRLTPEARP